MANTLQPLVIMRSWKNAQFLFKVKEGENSKHPDRHRDRHPYLEVFRGLELEPDAACPAITFGDGGRLGKRGRFSKVSLYQIIPEFTFIPSLGHSLLVHSLSL
jgi:hypothetical protein